jgi:hypothetical protein
MGMPTKLLSTGAAVAGIVLALPALPAAAGPDASGRILVFTDVVDDVFFEEDFCGIENLDVDIHDTGRARGFFTFRGQQSIPYFTGTFHITTTITEPDGTTVTIVGNNVDKDQRIEVDGDILTITGHAAGGAIMTGPEGRLRDPGMVFYQFVVDSNGTLQDPEDDTFLEDLGLLRDSTGLNEFQDFCAGYREVTGRT